MWQVLETITQMMAPVLTFTAEEIWQQMRAMNSELPASVMLTDWPEKLDEGIDPAVEEEWDMVMLARQAIQRGLESARSKGAIGHPLDADVQVKLSEYYMPLKGKISDDTWRDILIVSSCKVVDEVAETENLYNDESTGLVIGVSKSKDEKCPRCWRRMPEVAEKGVCDRCADVLAKLGR